MINSQEITPAAAVVTCYHASDNTTIPPYIAKMYLEAGLMACLANANCTGHMEKQEMEIETEMEN